MVVTLDDIRQKFDALHLENEPRESVAHFALQAIAANDARLLEMTPASCQDKIWRAIKYLSGVDLQKAPDRYLHSSDNFAAFRNSLGI